MAARGEAALVTDLADERLQIEMTGRAPTTSPFEELDHRESAGIEVSLLWNRTNDSLSVFVCDTRTVELFLLPTAPHEALDVFRHPFAYAARAA